MKGRIDMKQIAVQGLFVAALVVFGVVLFGQSSNKKAVSVEEAQAMIVKDSSVVILDVRTPAEYTGELGHVKHSILIPIHELEHRLGELDSCKGKTILAICRTGRRSGNATDILATHGFKVLNVEGGMVQWNAKQLPVEKESEH